MHASRAALLLLVLAGCGPRSSDGAGGGTAGESATGDEETVAAAGPCTTWDPAADPTIAPLDVAAPPATARRGARDLRFCILREGTGTERPTRESRVRVHYTGWTTDGVMFDSSHSRGEPAASGSARSSAAGPSRSPT